MTIKVDKEAKKVVFDVTGQPLSSVLSFLLAGSLSTMLCRAGGAENTSSNPITVNWPGLAEPIYAAWCMRGVGSTITFA